MFFSFPTIFAQFGFCAIASAGWIQMTPQIYTCLRSCFYSGQLDLWSLSEKWEIVNISHWRSSWLFLIEKYRLQLVSGCPRGFLINPEEIWNYGFVRICGWVFGRKQSRKVENHVFGDSIQTTFVLEPTRWIFDFMDTTTAAFKTNK